MKSESEIQLLFKWNNEKKNKIKEISSILNYSIQFLLSKLVDVGVFIYLFYFISDKP